MQTIIQYFLLFMAALVILYWIPITREMIRPILAGVGNAVVWIVIESRAWVIFLLKAVYSSHTEFIKHLFSKRSDLIAEEKIREISREGIDE